MNPNDPNQQQNAQNQTDNQTAANPQALAAIAQLVQMSQGQGQQGQVQQQPQQQAPQQNPMQSLIQTPQAKKALNSALNDYWTQHAQTAVASATPDQLAQLHALANSGGLGSNNPKPPSGLDAGGAQATQPLGQQVTQTPVNGAQVLGQMLGMGARTGANTAGAVGNAVGGAAGAVGNAIGSTAQSFGQGAQQGWSGQPTVAPVAPAPAATAPVATASAKTTPKTAPVSKKPAPAQENQAQPTSTPTPFPKDGSAEDQTKWYNEQAGLNASKQAYEESKPKNFVQRWEQNFQKMAGGMTSADRLANLTSIQKLSGKEELQPKDVSEMSSNVYVAGIGALKDAMTAQVSKLTALSSAYSAEEQTKGPVATLMHKESPNQSVLREQLENESDEFRRNIGNLRVMREHAPQFSSQGVDKQASAVAAGVDPKAVAEAHRRGLL